MDPRSPRWKAVTDSQFPWEREALDFVRERLPDSDPYLAWSNFEFVADDGSVNEVDLLVLTPKGFFLVEIKSRPGVVTGDMQDWVWKNDRGVFSDDNPLRLANRKAKRLKSLLQRHAGGREEIPFLRAVVFLSAPNVDVQLAPEARHDIAIRDRDADGAAGGTGRGVSSIPGIVALLKTPTPEDLARGRPIQVDRVVARTVARAFSRAGLDSGRRQRRVHDYRLGRLLAEGPGWQDFLGTHATLKEVTRRIRLYTVALGGSAEARETIARAARREFEILRGIEHRSILRALEYASHDAGPALLFEHFEKAQRLDHFLAEHGARLGIDARLSILRQLAEALKFAHGRRLFHRALSPSSILVVDPSAEDPQVRIFNWQTATREIASSADPTISGTRHLDRLVETSAEAYLAPEAVGAPDEAAESLDVFSLGAIAYHVFAGRPPAASGVELRSRLRQARGLDVADAVGGASEALRSLILESTAPEVHVRHATVADFLAGLALIEDELTRPESDAIANPLDAKPGDTLEGNLKVVRRLGGGATSVVYLVRRGDDEVVLKLASGAEQDARIRAEGEVLRKLRHSYIVALLDTVTVSGRAGLLLTYAGPATLRDRLKQEGPLSVDLLQRFGENVLETVRHLEEVGIAHRDIKPENIGVLLVSEKILRPILFDFSLSRTPPEQIHAGTRGYLEPFLETRQPRRWDVHAELWSAVVTLYEMATGTLPVFGDGKSDPAMLSCEATIEGDRMHAEVRAPLAAFFRKALRRAVGERYHNAAQALEAWRDAFRAAPAAAPETGADAVALTRQLEQATLDTSLASLAFSTRARNALDRANALSVRDLLRLPPRDLAYMRGVGHKTRRELLDAIAVLARRFPQPTAAPAVPSGPAAPSPDDVALSLARLEALVLTELVRSGTRTEDIVARALLGLDAAGRSTSARSGFPTFEAIGHQAGVTRARVSQLVERLVDRWIRFPQVTHARDEVVRLLTAFERVASFDELAEALAASAGAGAPPDLALHRARVALRVAIRVERTRLRRWVERRCDGGFLLALGVQSGEHGAIPDGEELADYAERLGQRADALAQAEDVPGPDFVEEKLREVARRADLAPLSRSRLIRLAAAASAHACASATLELYPRDMPAPRALRLAFSAAAGRGPTTPDEVRARIRARYPEAQPLPDHPALLALLREAGLDLRWEPAEGKPSGVYVPNTQDMSGVSSRSASVHRHQTSLGGMPEPTPAVAEARRFEERLARAARDGAYLVLKTAVSHTRKTIEGLLHPRFHASRVRLEALFLARLRAAAASVGADWNVVLRADAAPPGSGDHRNLRMLVERVVPEVEADLLAREGTVLLTEPGVLARYDAMGLLERLRDRLALRTGDEPTPLEGLWVVVPADGQREGPTIDGKAVPVVTAAEWAPVPLAWVENRHRASVTDLVERQEAAT